MRSLKVSLVCVLLLFPFEKGSLHRETNKFFLAPNSQIAELYEQTIQFFFSQHEAMKEFISLWLAFQQAGFDPTNAEHLPEIFQKVEK